MAGGLARATFLMAVATALWRGASFAEDVLHPIRPTLSADFDYRQYPSLTEGKSGFVLEGFRPGILLTPRPWFEAVGSFEFVAEHGAVIHDAYARLRAAQWLRFTVGYSKTPLFASFVHEPEEALAFPDRAPVVASFSGGRDLGVDARLAPRTLPLEAIVRVGNGTGSSLGNDNELPAGYASLDWVTGRARSRASGNELLGLRLGVGAMIEKNADGDGITGETPFGFVYFRPVIVSGMRHVAEGHVVAYAGPGRFTVEAAFADESRSRDDDGNPITPRISLEAMRSYGVTTEIAWTLRGKPRSVGAAPRGSEEYAAWDGGAVEVAVRYDGLWLGRDASDVETGGSQGGALALKWWPQNFLSASLSCHVTRYDRAPIEEPGTLLSWGVAGRFGFSWGE